MKSRIVCFVAVVLFGRAHLASAQINIADMSLSVADSPDPVDAGSNVSYTIQVTQDGPEDTAESVLVTTAVPALTTFVSATAPAGWTLSTPAVGGTGAITFSNPSLAEGTLSLTVVVRVNDGVPDGQTVTLSATVTVSNFDTNLNDNTDSESTTVNGADVRVSISDSPSPVNPNANLAYAIQVTNDGPGAMSGVQMLTNVPNDTTFFSMTAPAGWTLTTPAVGSGGSVVAAKSTAMADGEIANFTLIVRVDADVLAGETIELTVSVTPSSDANSANNSDDEDTPVAAAVPTLPAIWLGALMTLLLAAVCWRMMTSARA